MCSALLPKQVKGGRPDSATLGLVNGDANASNVESREVAQRRCITNIGCAPVKLHGLRLVLGIASAMFVKNPEKTGSSCLSSFDRTTVQLHGLGLVLENAIAMFVAHPEIDHG
jgi:hypothetical protein